MLWSLKLWNFIEIATMNCKFNFDMCFIFHTFSWNWIDIHHVTLKWWSITCYLFWTINQLLLKQSESESHSKKMFTYLDSRFNNQLNESEYEFVYIGLWWYVTRQSKTKQKDAFVKDFVFLIKKNIKTYWNICPNPQCSNWSLWKH